MGSEPIRYVPQGEPQRDGKAESKARPISLITRPALSLTELLGTRPVRTDIDTLPQYFTRFADEPLHGFFVQRKNNQDSGADQEFVIVGPQATAEGINALLYFAAPYKGFGIDTRDIINDWTALYNGTEENEKLRTAHATMPGWSMYEQSRELILDILKRDYSSYGFRNQYPNDIIIPTIHGTIDAEGKIALSIEPLDDELRQAIVDQLPAHVIDPQALDVGMGSVFVAAYSPDNAKWPENSGYQASSARKQIIGPTQVLAFAIRRLAERQAKADLVPNDQDIQQSRLLKAFTSYLVTGDKPEVASVAAQVPTSELYGYKEPPTLNLDIDSINAYIADMSKINENIIFQAPKFYSTQEEDTFDYKSPYLEKIFKNKNNKYIS